MVVNRYDNALWSKQVNGGHPDLAKRGYFFIENAPFDKNTATHLGFCLAEKERRDSIVLALPAYRWNGEELSILPSYVAIFKKQHFKPSAGSQFIP